ncbi:hypothetical protein [Neobacillus dielmonensis]|uniref:hypothetical protein n=1 Tax=Neobacillus dielmonensis TaxID=1347369 RepID=UPI0005A7979E|nr:hypothetical protein [Neobacillus dielmonensis]
MLEIRYLVNIIIAVFLAIDAPKHNKRPWLWAILGVFFGAIVLGIYFIQTGKKVLGWVITILALIVYIFIFLGMILVTTLGV